MDTNIFAFILRKWKIFHQSLLIPQSGKTELIFFILLYNFIKKRLWHWCFPVNLLGFLTTLFFKEQLRWLLLFIFKFLFPRTGKYLTNTFCHDRVKKME